MDLIDKYNIDLEYTGNGKLSIEGFCPDFANMKKKVCVEIYGDYWHCRKDIRERDYWRIGAYTRRGWKCTVIWASELKNEKLVIERLAPLDIL
jgi:very-short-patch-repair endonuclease